jgi:hypothetical protein
MGSILGVCVPAVLAQDPAAVALIGVLALTVVGLFVYALVARCLRDAIPADRPEILRALADLVGSLRYGEPGRALERSDMTRQPDDQANRASAKFTQSSPDVP